MHDMDVVRGASAPAFGGILPRDEPTFQTCDPPHWKTFDAVSSDLAGDARDYCVPVPQTTAHALYRPRPVSSRRFDESSSNIVVAAC